MAGIFICYRRADAEGWAGRLSDSFKAELGRVNIFRDIEDIPPGVEFEEYINDAVGSCDVLIALIGPRWLLVTDKTGARRLDDPKDFTRLEILTALKRNVRVIPALVGGAQIPEMDTLPDDIKSLARRQAFELSDSRWIDDCRKLANVLRPIVTPDRPKTIRVAVIALAVLIALAAGGYGFKLWIDHRSQIARQEAAAKEKVEQEKLAMQKAAEALQKQAELDKQRKEKQAQDLAALATQKKEPLPGVAKSQISEEAKWIPSLIEPRNGSTVSQLYVQRWRFKWDEPSIPGSVQQYHLRVFRPDAAYFLVDRRISTIEYTMAKSCSYIANHNRLDWKWQVRAQFRDGTWSSWARPSTFNVLAYSKEALCKACPEVRGC